MSEPLIPPVIAYAAMTNISREVALMHGLVEPTPEEAAEREVSARRWLAREVEAWRVYDLALPLIDALADPVSRAVLDLHARVEHPRDPKYAPECEECYRGDDREHWPCATVKAVAAANGIEVPDIELWRRPDEMTT